MTQKFKLKRMSLIKGPEKRPTMKRRVDIYGK